MTSASAVISSRRSVSPRFQGSSFYHLPDDGAQKLRFTFCKKTETLDAAAERLGKLLEEA